MKCLKIARLQDTPGLLGRALSGPQTLCREVRDSHCESTNPPLEIPAYGPVNITHVRIFLEVKATIDAYKHVSAVS